MSDALDKDLIAACQQNKPQLACDLIRRGANPFATDLTDRTALHILAGDIARTWPQHRESLEFLLESGLSLNHAGTNGTPMHALGYISGIHADDQRRSSVQGFLREAVGRYGADIYAPRPDSKTQNPVINEFVRNAKSFDGVVMTALSLDEAMADESRADMTRIWLMSHHQRRGTMAHAQWFAGGINPTLLDAEYVGRMGAISSLEEFTEWEKHNPVLTPEGISGKGDVLHATEVYPEGMELANRCGSPLFNPQNWQRMEALFAACAEKGEPITKEDVLAPIAEGQNFLQLAATVACKPATAMQLCRQAGIQLGKHDLLQTDGSPTATLQAFIDVKATPLLFTAENWKGQPPEDLKEVYHALPQTDRAGIPNWQQLRLRVEMDATSAKAVGR